MMNILYIGIYGVHSMELIYYIMKLEFVAMSAGEQSVSRWAGEQTLILGGPRGTCTATVLYCHQAVRGTREHSERGDHTVMVATDI